MHRIHYMERHELSPENFRGYLRAIDRRSLEALCRLSGMTDEDTDIITLFFSDRVGEKYLAARYGMSLDGLHKRKAVIVERLRHWCLILYPGDSAEEMQHILYEKIKGELAPA